MKENELFPGQYFEKKKSHNVVYVKSVTNGRVCVASLDGTYSALMSSLDFMTKFQKVKVVQV